jgi:hypothetical protein
MSPLKVFEIFFIFAQILRNSVEAVYILAKKATDTQYKYVVGFTSIIMVFWFLFAMFDRLNAQIHLVKNG